MALSSKPTKWLALRFLVYSTLLVSSNYTMVLQGFKWFSYLGWFSGILLLKSPRGLPSPFQKKHPFTIFIILVYLLNLLFRIDFYSTQLVNLREESMVATFLDLSLLIGETCFDAFFRLTFFLRSKLLVKFLKALEADLKKFGPSLNLSEKEESDWKFSKRLVWATLLFHTISGIISSICFSRAIKPNISFLDFLPESLHTLLYYFLGELPLTCTLSVTFSLVLVATFHILWIFYDFCETLQDEIIIYNAAFEKETQWGFAKQTLGELDFSVFSVTASVIQQKDQDKKPIGKDKLISKLEHLKLVCSQYDKFCGHLLLGLIVRAVYVLISTANSILLYDNPKKDSYKDGKHWLDVFTFITELGQLWLLPMGAAFSKKIANKKEQLSRMVIFMTNLDARTDLRNVMTAFTEWDWTLTGGPGFFTVEKSLLSGVN